MYDILYIFICNVYTYICIECISMVLFAAEFINIHIFDSVSGGAKNTFPYRFGCLFPHASCVEELRKYLKYNCLSFICA